MRNVKATVVLGVLLAGCGGTVGDPLGAPGEEPRSDQVEAESIVIQRSGRRYPGFTCSVDGPVITGRGALFFPAT